MVEELCIDGRPSDTPSSIDPIEEDCGLMSSSSWTCSLPGTVCWSLSELWEALTGCEEASWTSSSLRRSTFTLTSSSSAGTGDGTVLELSQVRKSLSLLPTTTSEVPGVPCSKHRGLSGSFDLSEWNLLSIPKGKVHGKAREDSTGWAVLSENEGEGLGI